MYAEMAFKLYQNGWKGLLPLNGKRPMIRGWQKYNQREMGLDEIRHFATHYPGAGIGLAMPGTVLAVDIDLRDEHAAASMEAHVRHEFGDTPLLRIGNWPKRLLLYGASAPVQTRRCGAVELFCGSGQVAIYGIHPDTGREYAWPAQAPIDVSPDQLPVVTPSQVEQLRSQLLQDGPQNPQRPPPTERPNRRAPLHRPLRNRAEHDQCLRWLNSLQEAGPGVLHETMVRVSASMVAAGLEDAAIFNFFEEHFAAPRHGPYSEVWDQIPAAVSSFRNKLLIQRAEVEENLHLLGLTNYRPEAADGEHTK